MKINKLFMLAMAGLAFAACNKQDEPAQFEGVGAVTIRVTSPQLTKSVESGTPDGVSTVKVTGDVTISLDATAGSNTITLTAEQLADNPEVTFWNVEGPQKVTVSMNEGKPSYNDDAPTVFAGIAPEAIPAYGETESFTLTSNTGSPSQNGSDHEAGANAGDDGKVYQLYEATVQLSIPVARLEVSGIVHVDGEGGCAYKTLTIAGVYLDNLYATGAGVEYSGGAFPAVSEEIAPTDYRYGGEGTGTGIEAILKDVADPTDFLAADGVWPADGNAYCYNFFGANGEENLPKFKIYFNESVSNNAEHPLPAPRYAMITRYKQTEENGGAFIENFVPGHIYRIKSAQLSDDNIIGDENGNTLYGVVVTVEEATWTVETIDAVWAE